MLRRFHHRIQEKIKDNGTAPVLIIPFGDSVTQGCMEVGVINHTGVYHNILKQKLEEAYPQCTFSVYNAGVSGASAGSSLFRLSRDVILHHPDLVILGFCLNDATMGLEQLEIFEQNIRTIAEKIKSSTEADAIILTPNFMATYVNTRIAEVHQRQAEKVLEVQNNGILKKYSDRLKRIAEEFNFPVADIYQEWETMTADGIDTTSLLVNGLNHPDAERQKLIATKVFQLIQEDK